MGIGLRIFLVNDDDSLERLAVARYDRLLRRNLEERLPQYAGKRVRYALVAYEVENRKPVEILRIEYNYLSLGSMRPNRKRRGGWLSISSPLCCRKKSLVKSLMLSTSLLKSVMTPSTGGGPVGNLRRQS